jgi:hypothetical protein
VSEEEKAILTARRAELTAELEEVAGMEKALAAQNKAVKEELRGALRGQAALAGQLCEAQSRMDELILANKTCEEGMRAAVREKEEALVAHDTVQLEVRKLRDALSSRADEVFGLENKGAQLAMSIEARKREVEAERVIARAAAKLAEEERHRLALDLAERQAAITLLRARYEALVAKGRPSGEGGEEPRSQAYYILQAAQKREELQREGDELDASCRRAEREIKALSAALGHLASRNAALREAFHRVDGASDEAGAVRALEGRLKETADALFRKRKELGALQGRMEEAAAQLGALEERLRGLRASSATLEAAARRVEGEREATAAALAETRERVAAARLRVRLQVRRGGPEEPCAEELAFLAQGVRECSGSVLFTLGQLGREFPQLRPSLAAAMERLGLRMPTKPPPRSALASHGGSFAAAGTAAGAGAAGAWLPRPASASSAGVAASPVTLVAPAAPAGAGSPAAASRGAFPASVPRSRLGPDGRPVSGASVGSLGSTSSLGGSASARGSAGTPARAMGEPKGAPGFSPLVTGSAGAAAAAGGRAGLGAGRADAASSAASLPMRGAPAVTGGGGSSRPPSSYARSVGSAPGPAAGPLSRPQVGSRPGSAASTHSTGSGKGGGGVSPMAAAGLSLVGSGFAAGGAPGGSGASRPGSGRSVASGSVLGTGRR